MKTWRWTLFILGAGLIGAAACSKKTTTSDDDDGTASGSATGTTTGTHTGTTTGTTTGTVTGTTTGTVTGTTTGTVTGTPTGGTTCDVGDCGNCINGDCAMTACSAELSACQAEQQCIDLNDCYFTTCEADCAQAGDACTACMDNCDQTFPNGVEPLSYMYGCLYCGACPADCDPDGSICAG